MKKITIIIPAYKEETAIQKVIDEINDCLEREKVEYEILVIDDGSPDKTAEIASKCKNTQVISHPFNRGVGAARKTGLRKAENEIIVMIDADNSYSAYDIPKLLPYIEDYDMVVGVRKKDYGSFIYLRGWTKWLLKSLASYISGNKIPDLNSGLRVFRKSTAINFIPILPQGHSWVSTMTLAYLCNDYTVKYVPIEYKPRVGKSTFHPIKDTTTYLNLILKTVFYFYPLKIFFPIGLGIFIWGSVRIIHAVRIVGITIYSADILIVLVAILIWVLGFTADLIVRQMSFQYQKYTENKD